MNSYTGDIFKMCQVYCDSKNRPFYFMLPLGLNKYQHCQMMIV